MKDEAQKNLEFVGVKGFDDIVDNDKKWELLDSWIMKDFPDFTPPTKSSSSKSFEDLETRCDEISTSLMETYTKLEEKVALAIAEKDKVLDLVIESDSKALAYKKELDKLSSYIFNYEV